MLDRNFDPYEILIETQERLSALEKAHNRLAYAFEQSEKETNQILEMLRALQQHHLRLRKDYDHLKQELRKP